jgi:hypothetical protein
MFLMSEIELKYADDENGDPIKVPGSTVKIAVMRHKKGQPGAPARVYLHERRFTVAPDASADALAVLEADSYRLQPLDAEDKRVGRAFYVEIIHLGGKSDGTEEPAPAAPSPVEAERERFYEEMRQERQELRTLLKETMVLLRQFAEKALDTQIEIAKAMPRTVEASATMLTAARGGGLSEVANEVREIMESAPDGGNNLETVLNSPVVVGAAAALQKYMAQAAQNGAETMASSNNGQRGENMAQRAARIAAQANRRPQNGATAG